jgi:hypothetical protein
MVIFMRGRGGAFFMDDAVWRPITMLFTPHAAHDGASRGERHAGRERWRGRLRLTSSSPALGGGSGNTRGRRGGSGAI